MKKLLLLGTMLICGTAAAAQDGGSADDQCTASSLPAIQQSDVATVERNSDAGTAVIELDVSASTHDGSAPTYVFSSTDGTITSDGGRATWTVSGAGPFEADVAVSGANGACATNAHFTYHMEQSPSG